MNIVMNLGTLAVVVLVVTTSTCLAVLLCLNIWTRSTETSQSLHCGHCHSLLALRGVVKAPESLPVSSPKLSLVAPHFPSQQAEAVALVGGGMLNSSPVNNAGWHGHDPHRIIATRDPTISTHSIPGTDSFLDAYPVNKNRKSSRIMSPSYLRKSDSTIAHPKHTMFQRTCSTRKMRLPRLRHRPCVQQPESGWLDISQMCRTVLSRISPRQRSNYGCNEDSTKSENIGCSQLNSREAEVIVIKRRQEAPVNFNYVYPLNDVERYKALVLETNNKMRSSPNDGRLDQSNQTNINRMSWGSTLPEYTEFLT